MSFIESWEESLAEIEAKAKKSKVVVVPLDEFLSMKLPQATSKIKHHNIRGKDGKFVSAKL